MLSRTVGLVMKTSLLTILLFAVSTASHAHETPAAMKSAAENFLASLDGQQKDKATFDFDDKERIGWDFVPKPRNGLPMKEMKPNQRQFTYALLQSALSHRGFTKAVNIMSLEQILHDMENNSPKRDPLLYYVSVFGTPSHDKTWGWRIEGHHLSVNFTLINGHDIVSTPHFLGTNPADVKDGPQKGLRVLAQEEDLARALVNSLSGDQKKTAVFSTEAPKDVINGPGRKATPLEPAGLSSDDMTPQQTSALMDIIREYVFNLRPELAKSDLSKIRKAGVDKIHFAWAGGLQANQPCYYRVQGPSFILEYDNTQGNGNHAHCVWRDFKNDFGEDILRRHYEEQHPEAVGAQ